MGPADDRSGVTAGLLLDDRYTLEQVRDDTTTRDGRRAILWRAMDSALDRHVAVLVVSGRTRAIRKGLADAATRAGRVADARWVRVLDVGEIEAGSRWTWVATEWVDAPSLTALVRHGPLAPERIASLVRQCAEALVVAERAGCRHGHLDPDRVHAPAAGVPRMTGLEVAAELAGREPRPVDDVRGLGGLLFAGLTGSWPIPGWTGLPEARTAHPRHLRRDTPRALDEITATALQGGYADPAAVAAALRAVAEPVTANDPAHETRRRRLAVVRRWAWRIVPPVVVLGLGVTGWLVGSALGRVPLAARTHRASLPATQASAPGVTGTLSLVWSAPPRITSFDPEGDGEETPASVGLAVDRDPSTSWTTVTYRGNSHLGGLKPGVGLLLDLRRPTAVRVAELALTASGSTVELRAGNTAPRTEADLPLVATTAHAGVQLRWQLPAATTARYWLVWFTNLPKASGGYRIGVTEVALLG